MTLRYLEHQIDERFGEGQTDVHRIMVMVGKAGMCLGLIAAAEAKSGEILILANEAEMRLNALHKEIGEMGKNLNQ